MEDIILQTNTVKSVIHCGKGAFAKYAPAISKGQIFLVTDTNVYRLYSGLIAGTFGDVPKFILPAGEKSKNYKNLIKILEAMLEAGMRRNCRVIALGGGVVGDIAGLVASLYMRGVHLVQIPTTLLSQVDSSVGGKTAIDHKGVKNVLGAFYQAEEVIVDPLFISTLPRRELRCGLGEIIKYGALNERIYNTLIKNTDNLYSETFLESIVAMCIKHKAEVVENDERETGGLRKSLNLGHTTGHALELYYGRKSHGEFVLTGMYYELQIARKRGICGGQYADNLEKLIKKVIKIPHYDNIDKAALNAIHDKKNVDENISLIVAYKEGEFKEIKLAVAEYTELIKDISEGIK